MTLDDRLLLEHPQPLGERPRADPGTRVLQLGEAARPLGEVVDQQRRPLRTDDLGGGGDRAGRRLVDGIHRPNGHVPSVVQAANGAGQASIFGIEKRAIVPKPGAGLQA